jgi:dipeptidyl aminopeptidase/acylaminoacyl peptidase
MEEAVTFYSEGYKLQGDIYVPDNLADGETRPGVLLCHGYTGLKDLYLPETARALNAAGYVVMAFDYKGWGQSEGPPFRLTPYSRVTDAHSALTFLGLRPEVDADRLGLFGWSYGGATVVWLAAHDPRAKCVVSTVSPSHGARWLESVRTPAEWADLKARGEADREKRVLTGESEWVPREVILYMDPDSKHLSSKSRKSTSAAAADKLPLEYVDETFGLNAEWVVEHISPRAVLFIACEDDKVAPVGESRTMFDCAGEPKKLVVIPGRGHYDAYFDDTFERVIAEATDWYAKHLTGS